MSSFYSVSMRLIDQEHRELISLMNRVSYSIREYLPWCSEEEVSQSSFNDTFKQFKTLFESRIAREENEIYPLLKNEPQCQFSILKARQAHHMALLTLAELRLLPYTHEDWGPKFHVLRDVILATIKEEEASILPWLTKDYSAEQEAFCA